MINFIETCKTSASEDESCRISTVKMATVMFTETTVNFQNSTRFIPKIRSCPAAKSLFNTLVLDMWLRRSIVWYVRASIEMLATVSRTTLHHNPIYIFTVVKRTSRCNIFPQTTWNILLDSHWLVCESCRFLTCGENLCVWNNINSYFI